MVRRLASCAALTLALAAPPAHAQFAAPPPNQPDLTISAAERAAIVETLAVDVQRLYVFPERGAELARALRRWSARGRYTPIASAKALADTLTADMQSVTHDLHMRVHYRYLPLPAQAPGGPPPADEVARQRATGHAFNWGFEQVRRLAGNVGYLDLRGFSGDPEAQATAVAAMNFLANSDAVIVDLRRNGGGDPAMIQTLLTYFVAPGDRLHINDFYEREGDRTEQWWSAAQVPGPRLDGRPLYVLTSPRTGSAAEEFAYDVQTHHLGTLVGETTAGAANPGELVRLHDHFAAFIARGRAVNPVTHTNWEGVGVKPDVAVPAADAVRDAHVAALEKLMASAKDDETRARLARALEQAKQAPSDDPGEFVRPSRRQGG